MFIFIEVTADVAQANPTDFLYTDKIEFHNISGLPQTVELVTLIQDAYFIYPQRSEVNGEFLYETVNLGIDDQNENIIATGSNLDENELIAAIDSVAIIADYYDNEIIKIAGGVRAIQADEE